MPCLYGGDGDAAIAHDLRLTRPYSEMLEVADADLVNPADHDVFILALEHSR
jgi:hypothetical protein